MISQVCWERDACGGWVTPLGSFCWALWPKAVFKVLYWWLPLFPHRFVLSSILWSVKLDGKRDRWLWRVLEKFGWLRHTLTLKPVSVLSVVTCFHLKVYPMTFLHWYWMFFKIAGKERYMRQCMAGLKISITLTASETQVHPNSIRFEPGKPNPLGILPLIVPLSLTVLFNHPVASASYIV